MIYTSIFSTTAAAIQRAKLENCGRLWLVARLYDSKHSGRVEAQLIQDVFRIDGKQSISRRRVDQIIQQGEGRFWSIGRANGRRYLYIYNEARIAAALGVSQVRGYATGITDDAAMQLIRCDNMRRLRSLWYDLVHSGRTENRFAPPIARSSIATATGLTAATQRDYETERGIKHRKTFAIIGRYSADEMRHQRGRDQFDDDVVGGPAFPFVDFRGLLDEHPAATDDAPRSPASTRVYIARQLGNQYAGTLPIDTSRSIRRINARLSTLHEHSAQLAEQATGNGQIEQRYFESDQEAQRRRDYLSWQHEQELAASGYRTGRPAADQALFVERGTANTTTFYNEALFFGNKAVSI